MMIDFETGTTNPIRVMKNRRRNEKPSETNRRRQGVHVLYFPTGHFYVLIYFIYFFLRISLKSCHERNLCPPDSGGDMTGDRLNDSEIVDNGDTNDTRLPVCRVWSV